MKEKVLMMDLYTRFQQRLTAVGGECYLLDGLQEAATVIAQHPAFPVGEKEVVVPPDFSARQRWCEILPFLEKNGIRIREAGNAAGVADAPAGLSNAELAIAETGSVMLAENSLEARVVSMLTLTHFILVSARKLVPMLEQAADVLQQLTRVGSDQRHYISLITGPSRTADIERTLTIGVQGPKLVCVLFIQDEDENE